MIYRHLTIWLALISLCVAQGGCGQSKPAVETPPAITPTSEVKQTSDAPKNDSPGTPVAANNKVSPLVATAPTGTAEAAFQQTLVAFQEGRLASVYENLPASYQKDVESIVHEFADKMDAEIWSKSFAMLVRVSEILHAKKSLILGLETVKRSPQFETLRSNWDSIASGLQLVANSEFANLNNVKRCDVRKLLGIISQLLTNPGIPLPKFGDVSVTTVESNADTATLSYKDSKDAQPKQVEFVKVEGKWLPKSIASNWSDEITNVRSKLAELPGLLVSAKPVIIQQLDGINGILGQVEQANSPEQMNGAILPLFLSIELGKGMAEQAIRDADSSRKPNAVYVIVNRELNEDAQTKIKDAVVAALEDSNAEYEIIPNDGKTRFRFSTVKDSLAILAAVQQYFEGAKVDLDAESKTIRVELK